MSESVSQLADMTINEFLESLGSKAPIPGGGAVAGVSNAIAAGLGGMVVAYSLGKKSLAAHQTMLEESTLTLKELRERSMRQADDDAAAYGNLNALWSRPADDPERVDGFQDAVRGAIKAPGAIMETSSLILEVLERLPGCSAPHLASDLAIAIETATMGARAAERNVTVNLPMLTDEEERQNFDETFGALGLRIDTMARGSMEAMNATND
tara:strand:+ start:662 stop:1294 length:633 start_codon:yes stop_codon:yes gene_type:complete